MHSEKIDKLLNDFNVDRKTGLKTEEISARQEKKEKNK